jgi:hypothetical protein
MEAVALHWNLLSSKLLSTGVSWICGYLDHREQSMSAETALAVCHVTDGFSTLAGKHTVECLDLKRALSSQHHGEIS